MRLLYKNIYIVSIYGCYVMVLYSHKLQMIENIHKYFGDFINFIS
jgi:hypothetical protein